MMASAAGASRAVSRLIAALAKRKATELIANSIHAIGFARRICRAAVRGFFWSMDQSLRRLKSMAAVRARTMQRRTSASVRKLGWPFAATSSAPRAKGRAKIVCENRISRRKRMTRFGGTGSICILTMLLKQLLQALSRLRQNRHAMGEKHSIERIIQQLRQRPAHHFEVRTVFRR